MAWSTISCLGPAFLVYVGCMDPGKWVTALEGGSLFGLELAWVMIAACVFAAFLQSLSSRLGLATGRNLAQICGDEYPRYLSVLLWIQCEISVLILDLTMVLGIAMTLNALLGFSMVASVVATTIDAIVFLLILPHVGLYNAEIFTASIMGVVLLCFTVEALFSNAAPTPAIFQELIPKLKGDMLYIAAGIFGANIIPCNFYLHSAVAQDERRRVSYESGVLLHPSIVDILTGSGATLLINLAVLSAAAAAFHNSGHVVITLQDAQALMEQVLSSSVAPAAFGFALLCAGQLSSFSLTKAGQVATEGFLGFKFSLSFHRVFTRLAAALTAICLVWSLGGEGTYQALIFSQVILALQLPFAIVPLLKVTSSQAVMGSLKNSLLVESILWVCTGFLYIMNVWVAFDMSFVESEDYEGPGSWNLTRDLVDWSTSWREAMRILCLICVVGVTTISTLLIMKMLSAPFKAEGIKPGGEPVSSSAESISGHSEDSYKSDTIEKKLILPGYNPVDNYSSTEKNDVKHHETVRDNESSLPYELINELLPEGAAISGVKSLEVEQGEILDASATRQEVSEKESHMDEMSEDTTFSTVPESKEHCLEPLYEVLEEQKPTQAIASTDDVSFLESSSSVNSSSRESFLSWAVSPPELTTAETKSIPATKVSGSGEAEPLTVTGLIEDVDFELLDKDDYDLDGLETLDQDDVLHDSLSVLGGSVSSLTFEEPESGRSFSARSDASEGSCGGSGSGSLSRLSGLGRSARKNFASLLDDFWKKLYDLHGQSVSQLHGKSQGASTKGLQSVTANHLPVSAYKDAFGPNSTWYTSTLAQKSWQNNVKGDMAGQTDAYLYPSYRGSTPDSFGGNDPFLRGHSSLDASERRYSSLRYPSFRDGFDNQPATIHGYKMASYAGRNGSFPTGMDTSSFLLERQRQLMQRSSDEQSLPASSLYGLSSTCSESETSMSTNSVQSFLSSTYTKQSLGRQYGSFSLPSKSYSTQTDRPDPYSGSQWTPYTGRDSATWDPLVYRATGELDIPHYDQIALQRDKDSLNPSFAHRTVERNYFGTGSNNSNHFKAQIDRGTLPFDEISPSQSHKDAFSIQSAPQNQSLWATQPFELFGSGRSPIGSGRAAPQSATNKSFGQNGGHVSARNLQTSSAGNDHDIEVLNMLRLCIRKLLKLDGSEWLFRFDSGSDEDLIGTVASREKVLLDADATELHKLHTGNDQIWVSNSQISVSSSTNDLTFLPLATSGVPHCGGECVWNAELLISFGVWCIHRVLELALMESRPELWGKYTYVLNRLQGVLDPAFSKPRIVSTSCICVISEVPDGQGRGLNKQGSLKDGGIGDMLISRSFSGGIAGNSYQGYPQSWPWGRNSSTGKGKGASSSIFLEIIKDVETAIGTRKGRTGTAAGDVAFPKGKENLASVLKRYKRRLGNKGPGTPSNSSSNNYGIRRAPASSPNIFM